MKTFDKDLEEKLQFYQKEILRLTLIFIQETFSSFERYLKWSGSVKFPVYFSLNFCCNVVGPL